MKLKYKRSSILFVCFVAACSVQMPVLSDEAEQGQDVYEKWCVPCHSEDPQAPGTQKLGRTYGPEQAVLAERSNLPGEYVASIVRSGLGSMPPFRRTEITDTELEWLTEYLQSVRQAQSAASAEE